MDTNVPDADTDQKPGRLRLAVDFDDTIARPREPFSWKDLGTPYPHMAEFLRLAKRELGATIIIHSCRTTVGYGRTLDEAVEQAAKISSFLKEHDIPADEIWMQPGKPRADYYMDDKALQVCPQNWGKATPGLFVSLLKARFFE